LTLDPLGIFYATIAQGLMNYRAIHISNILMTIFLTLALAKPIQNSAADNMKEHRFGFHSAIYQDILTTQYQAPILFDQGNLY